jgi:hypothetical protein
MSPLPTLPVMPIRAIGMASECELWTYFFESSYLIAVPKRLFVVYDAAQCPGLFCFIVLIC